MPPAGRTRSRVASALLACGIALPCAAESERRSVVDDLGREVALAAPARRVIALSPHIAENLFAIGAGERVAGTVRFSDFPEAANDVPRIGGYSQIDLEKILSLDPDLVVAWTSGGNRQQAERLEELGITVFYSESRDFDDVASTFERLGRLTGADAKASEVAAAFRARVAELRQRYSESPPVSVFYQVWEQPLMTVSDQHLIAQAIALCGGDNVFGGLDTLIPRISIENVLAADPEIIIAGGMGEERRDWLEAWRQWPDLQAVRNERLFFIPPSLIQRHTPRVLEGTSMLCDALDAVRQARAAPSP